MSRTNYCSKAYVKDSYGAMHSRIICRIEKCRCSKYCGLRASTGPADRLNFLQRLITVII